MNNKYINNKEFIVAGMRRSGHHAIINWILANTQGIKVFLNDNTPNTNPFESGSTRNSQFIGVDRGQAILGNHSPRNLLIYNYEDKRLTEIPGENLFKNHNIWLGTTRTTKYILVLRDPFNLIASKLRWYQGKKWKPTEKQMMNTPNLWKIYAKEFLGETNHITGEKVVISYNMWFQDTNYRNKIAKELTLKTSHKGINEIAKWGPNTWGDSFDNDKYDGNAKKMKVLERWKHYINDPFYRKLVDDKELQRLSGIIFGCTPFSRFAESIKSNY